jgi:hypothetical protein
MAQMREKDDFVNAGVAGFVTGVGVALRSPQLLRMAAYGGFGSILSMFAYWAKFECDDTFSRTPRENAWKDKDTFFTTPMRDPFLRRWEELKARGLPGTKLAEPNN